MRRLALFIHGLLILAGLVCAVSAITLMVMYGKGELPRLYVKIGTLAYTLRMMVLCGLVLVPALLFSTCRFVQLWNPAKARFSGWQSLPGLSRVFLILTLIGTVFMIYHEGPTIPDMKYTYQALLKQLNPGESTEEKPVLTDESLDYPELPLQTPDYYDWSLKTLDGESVPVADFRGKVLFLNFWATWCGPCRSEMPSIQRLYDTMKDTPGLAFVFVSNEEAETVNSFLNKEGYSFPVYLLDKMPVAELTPRGIPATYILTPDGRLAFQHAGAAAWDTEKTAAFLKALLAETPAPVSE